MGINVSIKNKFGFWTVNGKKLNECNKVELDFFNKFIQNVKIEYQYCRIKKS